MDFKFNSIKEYLVDRLSPYLIIVFGSFAKQKQNKDSDIDIAFLSDDKFEPYDLFIISQNLAAMVERDIDLVDLDNASTVFKAQIIGTGKEIYNINQLKSSLFKMKTLKEYALLNEERQCILDKIKQRGSIYEY